MGDTRKWTTSTLTRVKHPRVRVTPKRHVCTAPECAETNRPAGAGRQNSSHRRQGLSVPYTAALLSDGDGSQVAAPVSTPGGVSPLLQEVVQGRSLGSHLPRWTWNTPLCLPAALGTYGFSRAQPSPHPLTGSLGRGRGPPVATRSLSDHSTAFLSPCLLVPRAGEAEWPHILRLAKTGRFTCSGEARKAWSLGRALRRAT